MKRQRLIAGAAAGLVIVSAAPVGAAPHAGHRLPFNGSATTSDGYADPTGCSEDAAWRYLGDGTGTFAHLGRVRFEIQHCTVLTGPTTGYFGDGTITITAANGDQLLLAQTGTFELVQDEAGLWSYVDLEWQVIGGTGRFAGATGYGTSQPVGNLAANTTTADFDGWIAYDASQVSDG